jgi:hypothetical protein
MESSEGGVPDSEQFSTGMEVRRAILEKKINKLPILIKI